MKAENQLQMMMDFYGDIFYTRKACLDHLFCVIGNGYEWENGELVEKEIDERFLRYKFKKDVVHAEPTEHVKCMGELRERLRGSDKNEDTWYPIAKDYSYICNYPDDIKPDWLNILNECKEMLKADGIDVPQNNGYEYRQ